MTIPRFFWIIIFFCHVNALPGQRLVSGLGVAVGTSWEVEYLPLGAPATEDAQLIGATGYGLEAVIGYELENFLFALRPQFLVQQTMAYLAPRDDAPDGIEVRIYPNALLLPLRVDYRFGVQRFRPTLGVGGGFLVDLSPRRDSDRLRPEPVLPYVTVAVGAEVHLGKYRVRPELTVRNGTGDLFSASGSPDNGRLPGQRWAYVSFGLMVTK